MGSQIPTHRLTPDTAVYSRGDEAIELADIVDVKLDPWQKLFLRDGLGVADSGRWASFEVGIELSRQNGKSAGFEIRAMAGLFLFRERLVTYTAHKGETALEAFRRIDDLISDVPELKAEVKAVTRTNGKEAIELHSRQRIKFRTRTSGGGRGLVGDCVILDEAQDLDALEIAALLPVTLARPNPQIWYGGSAGGIKSTVLGRLVKRLEQADPRLTMWRFAAEENDDPAAPRTWAKTNPALGRRILVETIANLQRAMPPDEFAREILGIGDYPRDEGEEWVIPRSAWERAQDSASVPAGPVVFAVEVKWGRDAASIATAGRRADGAVHGEVTAREFGTRWVAKELARQMSANPNLGVVLDPGGPGGSLLGDLADEGITPHLLTTRDVTQAWGAFFDLVTETPRPGFFHRGAPILTTALAASSTRKIGDATTWSRQGSGVDVAPLIAVTWATHGLTLLGGEQSAPSPRAAGPAVGSSAPTVDQLVADLATLAF